MNKPYIGYRGAVKPEWIDVNGHMNATHFGLVIYEAHAAHSEWLGFNEEYVDRARCGKAVLESHMRYEREAGLGDQLEVRCWLLAVDNKRLHFFHELYNCSRQCRSATSEQVDIHIDLQARRSADMPESLQRFLRKQVRENLAQPLPLNIGSQLRPPRNTWLDGE